jgi:gliding motility-associated-like protein
VLDSIVGNYGCVRHINGNYVVTVDDMPQAFGGVYDPVCSNEIQLNAVPSIVNSSGFWQGTGTFEDPRSNSTLFTAAGYGEQMLSWTEVNTKNENCKDISLVTIRFDEMPDDPYAGKDQKIYLEYSAILEADPAGLGLGTWTASNPEISIEDPNDPNTAVENLKMGTQIFTWTVVNGVCEAKADSMVIEVKGLTYPNGFSPNGDGVNDLFKIMGAWKIGDNELMVFDRNGKLVYSQKNYRNDWNGTGMDGSPLDDGTYYYIFTGKNIDPIKEYLIIKRTKNNR